jgi:hypothetical protein
LVPQSQLLHPQLLHLLPCFFFQLVQSPSSLNNHGFFH